MITGLSFPKFLAAWVPALAVSAAAPEVVPELQWIVHLSGQPVPMGSCILGLLGIALSRPLARKGEAELGWPVFMLVSAIMLILVELWILETWPSWLYTFVVSIGLGFSGYSVLELIGEQVKGFIRAVTDRAKSTLGKDGNSQ